ncbi:DUF983 domain-containing protein [Altererythrobacter indicus]|uniref:DUF983 domain-containing protein n=1 Tax=Altericroceibacterium indicum TaxID=374177 RepID=A0A845A776_9SPHN|nr:DUF983 domain-containing protein [Altericroceibacterium indicum]MXP24655.1 DUF983 domain-containing protein [Altericroceibacterium indicum]
MADQINGNQPSSTKHWPRLSPLQTGLRGRCPRCGEGRLFDGFLTLRKGCDVCGLSYEFADPADGPAFFVTCFACIPAIALALIIQVKLDPPFWVHLIVSLPILILTCVLPLRPLKGWLTCSQFFYKAGEGQLHKPRD